MQITIESTDQVISVDGVPCRIWRGVSGRGVDCFVFVHRIAVEHTADTREFERELRAELEPGLRSLG